jgi:hypothetical protein
MEGWRFGAGATTLLYDTHAGGVAGFLTAGLLFPWGETRTNTEERRTGRFTEERGEAVDGGRMNARVDGRWPRRPAKPDWGCGVES